MSAGSTGAYPNGATYNIPFCGKALRECSSGANALAYFVDFVQSERKKVLKD
jgi:hypothetical protein